MEVISLVEALAAPSPADHPKGWQDFHTGWEAQLSARKPQQVPVGQKLPPVFEQALLALLALIFLFLASEGILYFSTALL